MCNKWLLLLLIVYIGLHWPNDVVDAVDFKKSNGGVVPLPFKIGYGSKMREVHSGHVHIRTDSAVLAHCDIFQNAQNTYVRKWLFPRVPPPSSSSPEISPCSPPSNRSLRLHVKLLNETRAICNADLFPNEGMNEEYTLMVPESGDALLQANEIWGILRGLETFSQLIFTDNEKHFIRTATVEDRPEYPFRGVMLDTGRHFLHKSVLLRQIDLLAQNKMNVLHWHISDEQSFPLYFAMAPNLTRKGSYSGRHIYTPEAVKEILAHARLRGVRVVAEFDTPGHMASWRGADIMAECRDESGHRVKSLMLDPSREETFTFLRNFFTEVLNTFPDAFIHLGGDESAYWTEQCWANNPAIREFMAKNHMTSIRQLLVYYTSRLQKIVEELFEQRQKKSPAVVNGGKMIFWQEVLDYRPDISRKNVIIHNWLAWNNTQIAQQALAAIQNGYQVLVSSCWYVNHIKTGPDWNKYQGPPSALDLYNCNPRGFVGTEQQKQMVLGGVATMWGEHVDGTSLEPLLWPRVSAVAERLWSPPDKTTDADAAWPRLQEHRCRMIARGFRAQPINGPDFCEYPYQ